MCKTWAKFNKHGLRVDIDDRNESMGYKTRQIQKSKIPFMLVVGDREKDSDTVSIRAYGSKKSDSFSVAECLDHFVELDAQKIPQKFRE